MDIDTLFRLLIICIALVLLLPTISIKPIFTKLLSWLPKRKSVTTTAPISRDVEFLHMVDLWFQLKDKCISNGLDLAVEKLDEAFPLLNKDHY